MKRGLRLPSGRVIAVGRLMLATLFMLSIWLDISQPPAATYVLLAAYVGISAALLVATWNSWWFDAQLAGPAHALDIILFTLLVFSTEGYTSPFFTFFIFLLLSASIRWGWRATALTAVLVTLLYLLAGLLVAQSTAEFDLQPFVIRTGHLVILSLILIWFGINQWRSAVYARGEDLVADPSLDESPLETSLRAAMRGMRARSGVFVWREHGSEESSALLAREGEPSVARIRGSTITDTAISPFLYDLHRDRALTRDSERSLRAYAAHDLLRDEAISEIGLRKGIAVPVRTGAGEGELFLEGLNLSTDHIGLGEQLGADVAAHIQRHALLKAAEEGAEARSRLSLARDLHDSVVQFLAGTAIRLEAMKRSEAAGRDLEPDLNELKQLVLQEQGELRSFIDALRRGSQISVDVLAKDLSALADRLSRQWDVKCNFSAQPVDMMIPTRLHLDAHHLAREAVANAVRHAGAKSVRIALSAASDELRLEFLNDGARFPSAEEGGELPRSIQERVEQAGGALDLSRGMDVTKLSVSLPIDGRGR